MRDKEAREAVPYAKQQSVLGPGVEPHLAHVLAMLTLAIPWVFSQERGHHRRIKGKRSIIAGMKFLWQQQCYHKCDKAQMMTKTKKDEEVHAGNR
ncbi:MAG: hypothetical protein VKJ09_10055 [Leptolyngbya sp.]|nr:hypothetical protein [Leptolyngbya sp.]